VKDPTKIEVKTVRP